MREPDMEYSFELDIEPDELHAEQAYAQAYGVSVEDVISFAGKTFGLACGMRAK